MSRALSTIALRARLCRPALHAATWTLAAALPLAAAFARPVVDPTVPPAAFARSAAGQSAAQAPAPAPAQMIVRGPGEARLAVIGGQSVRAGDTIRHDGREMRVARITDGAVVLEAPRGVAGARRVTLELVPQAGAAVRCAAATKSAASTPEPCARAAAMPEP